MVIYIEYVLIYAQSKNIETLSLLIPDNQRNTRNRFYLK